MRGTDHDVWLKVDILTYRMAGWSRVGVAQSCLQSPGLLRTIIQVACHPP